MGSLMRRTTSATWSSLTSSSPPPPKSLSTRLHNIAEFQEFPGNRKKKDQWNCKSASRGERKKAPSTPSGAADANLSNPDTLRTRNIGTKFSVSLQFPIHSFGDQSSVIISVESIDLTFVFFLFSFCCFFFVRKLDYANYLLSY